MLIKEIDILKLQIAINKKIIALKKDDLDLKKRLIGKFKYKFILFNK